MRLASGGKDTDVVIIDTITSTGKCRLTGHSGSITDTCFYENDQINNTDIVISSSTDKQIKFWNIATQCCFQTIVDHTTVIYAIALLRGGDFLVAGSDDSNINVYKLTPSDDSDDQKNTTVRVIDNNIVDDQIHLPLECHLAGTIKRADARGRICNLVSDPSGKLLVFHGTKSKIIETFVFYSKEEAEKKCKKRLKKNTNDEMEISNISLSDEIKRLPPISINTKLKSIDVLIGGGDNVRIVGSFENNSIRAFGLNLKVKKSEPEVLRTLQSQGHSSEVRTVCFSSDALAIASGDGDSLKLWNRDSMRSVQTINQTGYALCCCFAPGDRHVLIGRMDGVLVIVDIVSGEILEEIPAHQKELWSMALISNGSGIVTAGGDATVKFWHFELIDVVTQDQINDIPNRKVLSLLHKNTLKLEETVQCIGVSKNGKFLAVGLLDSTVKLFFMDTLKFYLALYGHKLSILSLDISDDSAKIVTGSADRNIKIWGMDFGDCHKSLFAHNDSVMCVKFVPKTHMFWSCGKDGKIKYWDADSFVLIQTVSSHLGQAYCLDVSKTGHYLVSSGSDRTLRLFERSDEPIVLEDQQEMEREEIEQQELATGEDIPIVAGVVAPLNLPSRKTVAAEQAVELIMDALEILCNFKDAEKGEPIPLLMRAHNVSTPIDLIVAILARIKSSDLEEALILLPFTSVCELLKALPQIISNRTDQTELLCKVITFLFRVHRKPIVGNQNLLPFIQEMVLDLENTVTEQRDIIGKNLFALKMVQHDVEQDELENGAELFYDAVKAKKKRDQKMKMRQMKKKILLQTVS